VAIPFLLLPALAHATGIGAALALPLVAAPFAVWLVVRLARTPIGPALNDVLKSTAQLQLVFGALLAVALVL